MKEPDFCNAIKKRNINNFSKHNYNDYNYLLVENKVIKLLSIFFLLSLGKRKTGKAKIKRRETERKTGGKGSQGKGKARSQKKAWPGKTRKASRKGEKRERESGKEGERGKRTIGKEREERWGKKKTGRGKKVWLFPWRIL